MSRSGRRCVEVRSNEGCMSGASGWLMLPTKACRRSSMKISLAMTVSLAKEPRWIDLPADRHLRLDSLLERPCP